VVELIGNGKSSRALIRKGRLSVVERTGSAGHVFKVFNENHELVEDARLWISGHEYEGDDEGEIAVPFTATPGRRTVVVSDGDFSSLRSFQHDMESYRLSAGFHAERESLRSGAMCRLLVNAQLLVAGTPADLDLLENVKLTIVAMDGEDVATTTEIDNFELSADKATVHEFRVPADLRWLEIDLTAKVMQIGTGKAIDLSDGASLELNAEDAGTETQFLHFRPVSDGYVLQVSGKSGEKLADRPVQLTIKHRDFRTPVHCVVQSDEDGLVHLGVLEGHLPRLRAPDKGPWQRSGLFVESAS